MSAESGQSLGKFIPKKNSICVVCDYFGFEVIDAEQKKRSFAKAVIELLPQHVGKKHHRPLFEECVAKKST